MNWLVFSYSLPPKSQSSPRVTLWRRLRRLGAISPKTGFHILPARDECLEAFQWLAQEVQQLKGEAVVMHVERFEGLDDSQLIELFREVRSEEYAEIETQAEELEKALGTGTNPEEHARIRDTLAKVRRRYADVVRVDFFDSPEGTKLASRLARIEQALHPKESSAKNLAVATIAQYQDKQWVTRPRPFVDRLACAWLIRRFINPNAVIRYSPQPESDEVAFDMKGSEFGHSGNLCSFETMIVRFSLDKPSLRTMAEIVHELDLRDGQYVHPEAAGIEVVIRGWLLSGLSDSELESRGIGLFEGLYAVLEREQKQATRL